MNEADAEHLAQLRDETLRSLTEAIGPIRDVAVVDAPNQINVGDSLIWAGELAYLRTLGLNIRYVSDLRGYEAHSLRRAMPKGVVLIHGGGNFGDLWPGHQWIREKIVRDLPDYRIVQLPQSIYFGLSQRAAEANEVLGHHHDFHVLVRDVPSIQRAEAEMPDVRVSFCHDMALGWDAPGWSPPSTNPPRLLAIARSDKESSSGLASVGPAWLPHIETHVTDWGDLGAGRLAWERARRRAGRQARRARYARRLPPLRWSGFQPGDQRTIAEINRLNITAGVGLYDTAAGVVVDRLHAHIIAALRGIPHIMLDNNYGKLRAVYEASTSGFSTARYVTSIESARRAALEMLS